MKDIVIIGNEDINKHIIVASHIQDFATTIFKDVETGNLSTEIPTNRIFEITNILRDKEIKSGRENRRERRKQERKSKL